MEVCTSSSRSLDILLSTGRYEICVLGQGQGYITTNNQSVSMSWYRAQSRTVDQSLLSP
jgi:hypothetical protein